MAVFSATLKTSGSSVAVVPLRFVFRVPVRPLLVLKILIVLTFRILPVVLVSLLCTAVRLLVSLTFTVMTRYGLGRPIFTFGLFPLFLEAIRFFVTRFLTKSASHGRR